jgi:O-antigen ligase
MDLTAARVQVWLLVAALAGAALAYGPRGGLDGITVTKATIVVAAAVLAVAVAAWAAVRAGAVSLPRSPATLAACAFAGLVVLRTLFADDRISAVTGSFTRWTGMALCLACVVLFLVAAARGQHATRMVTRALLVIGLAVTLFALDEVFLGLGPEWAARPGAAGTLGNPNFLSSWAAIVLAIALTVALDRAQPTAWRVVGAVAVPALLTSMALSGSLQGGYVTAAVVAVVGLAWASTRLPRPAFAGLAGGVGLLGLVGAALTVLGALGRGPASMLADQIGVRLRVEYWAAAGRMIADHPFAGVGPGTFADHFREYRSAEAANLVSLASTTDAVHNVPLQVFAEWGPLVGLAHLAFLVAVTVLGVRELARREGLARLRYAGVVAAWVGYVLQSLISIDTPTLAVLGWVLAGLVVAPQVDGVWSRSLPWGRISKNRSLPAKARVADHATTLVTLALLWVVIIPYRADAASSGGSVEVDPDAEGPPATTRATEIASWESRYWMQLATVLGDQGEQELMAATMEHVLEVAPHRFEVVVNAARIAAVRGVADEAREHYEHALSLEPLHPDLAVEVGEFAVEIGDEAWARELAARALEVDPDHKGAQALRDTT